MSFVGFYSAAAKLKSGKIVVTATVEGTILKVAINSRLPTLICCRLATDTRLRFSPPDRPRNIQMAPIAGRCRIRHHLGNAVARYVEMLRCLTIAHRFRDVAPLDKVPRCRSLNFMQSLQKEDRRPGFYSARVARLSHCHRGRLLHRRSAEPI